MTEISQPAVDYSPQRMGPRVASFLAQAWGAPVEITGWERFPAGFSWTTIGFTADSGGQTRELILRVGDPRGLLAPYSARPEFIALSALQGIERLPVPKVYGYSDDASVIGAPFLITGRVAGDTPMPWRGDAEKRDESQNESLAVDFADALAAIHRVDWRQTELAQLWADVDTRTLALNQVEYWAAHGGLLDERGRHSHSPQLHYTMHWLRRHAPASGRTSIVHGDFRVGNFLQVDGRITAVLDWELVHLGDPLEDIAWAGLRVFAGGTPRLGGLFDREQFLERYARQSGVAVDMPVVRYYEVLGLFKSAAMLASAMHRVEFGRAGDYRMASMGFQLASTLLEINRLIAEAS
ncbi:phosphotransferase family protein [Caenimonas soli]|uniref:phosphotransferase family protein n=1 Tax=Caenimonas soli TaxID=2735555 RepID=UPI001554A5EF|nr:phosphotransferase family protein [Caenimonas soli]NPC54981.1 phosphotransferase family protein [Caenimonas soli]